MKNLIQKYNVPGPRYTSYPTVPYWQTSNFSQESWSESIFQNIENLGNHGLSIYIHLPFCESLCTFCGCHKRITKNHAVESPYIESLISEWQLYAAILPKNIQIKELHFGGGTPTFFDVNMLLKLLQALFGSNEINPKEVDLSFEAHPGNTTEDHLTGLYNFGFRRLSLGIQDYNREVQEAINRVQPFDSVAKVHQMAKEIGYRSISHDLVFGLPKQTLEHIHETINKTLELLPDRISLYSYAHVPWIKGLGQRGYSESDLPQDEVKRQLYEEAKQRLLEAGYHEVGMDHFALKHDELSVAMKKRSLHRNFMGYTTQNTNLLIGLGMSAISDSWYAFAQNEKTVELYQERVNKGELPLFRGHVLSATDLEIRRCILDIMCRFETDLGTISSNQLREEVISKLQDLEEDQLVSIVGNKVFVRENGIAFIRNVAMCFDQYLPAELQENLFSKTI